MVGGLVALSLLVFGLLYYYRRRERAPMGMYNRNAAPERIERIKREKPTSPGLGHVLIEPYGDGVEVADLRMHDMGMREVHAAGAAQSSDSLLERTTSSGMSTGGPGRHTPAEFVGGVWTYADGGGGAGMDSNRPPLTGRSRTDSFGPLRVQNAVEDASSSAGTSDRTSTLIGGYQQYASKSKLSRSSGTLDSPPPPEALASEVAELRREIERMRSAHEQGVGMGMAVPPPPSYEDDMLFGGQGGQGASGASGAGSEAGERDQTHVMRPPVDVKRGLL